MRWTEEQVPELTGKTFLVTGANSGLGFETTKVLARKGAHVIMAVRNVQKGAAAQAEIRGSTELKHIDLADLDSVRALAAHLHREQRTIDVLVNNAGIMMPPRQLSKQGHELQFAANHLGHFALTVLTLDLVTERVVTVSSGLHRGGRVHYEDLDGARQYNRQSFYSQSKFANVLFGLELDRRLRAAGDPRRSLLAHPGYSATNLQLAGPTGVLRAFMRMGNAMFAMPAAQGALNILYAATAPEAQSGQFIGPDRLREYRGWPSVVQPDPKATDEADAKRLWALSEQLTDVQLSTTDLHQQS
ncbi:oxidoreductase [Dactylosporangium matsuzakiense]|uniref:Short-chain dehydrogenase/reductase n=1 Tax=Dactylosporangium matsuzakiense TaxID=53360 RepID=A0A9W6KHS3_9ACTN|nr:oxidoreductase [Dactylosporangium matsuzakiense]UWZ45663.1 SDR family NAD(P)-dependent oxidoreductase [Dactylosporangium matsuzakiense]GLL00320.1 putative short-chain dehydrogenase/reductase [Dactylosporangium matsuzakiense]